MGTPRRLNVQNPGFTRRTFPKAETPETEERPRSLTSAANTHEPAEAMPRHPWRVRDFRWIAE